MSGAVCRRGTASRHPCALVPDHISGIRAVCRLCARCGRVGGAVRATGSSGGPVGSPGDRGERCLRRPNPCRSGNSGGEPDDDSSGSACRKTDGQISGPDARAREVPRIPAGDSTRELRRKARFGERARSAAVCRPHIAVSTGTNATGDLRPNGIRQPVRGSLPSDCLEHALAGVMERFRQRRIALGPVSNQPSGRLSFDP